MTHVKTNIGRDDEYSFSLARVFHSEIDLLKWLIRIGSLGGNRPGIKVRYSVTGSTAIKPIRQIVSEISAGNSELESLVCGYLIREAQKQARFDAERRSERDARLAMRYPIWQATRNIELGLLDEKVPLYGTFVQKFEEIKALLDAPNPYTHQQVSACFL